MLKNVKFYKIRFIFEVDETKIVILDDIKHSLASGT